MKAKFLASLSLLLLLSFSLAFPVDAKVSGGRTSSPTRSSPPSRSSYTNSNSNITRVNNTTTNTRVNNTANKTNTQSSMQINSGALPVTRPVSASYKPMKVSSQIPAQTTIVESTFRAPNPTNAKTERRYVTKYDDRGNPFTLGLVIPVGVPVETYSNSYGSYFPPAVNRGYTTFMPATTTVVDNTPTNGWDVLIFWTVSGFIIFIIFVLIKSR